MDTVELINQLIPYPEDYINRNGVNNEHIIDKLNPEEINEIEPVLLKMLSEHPSNILIVETLSYMKSDKAVPILKNILAGSEDESYKIILASSIFQINQDKEMVELAINELNKIENIRDPYYVYRLIRVFYYLIKFHNPEFRKIIKGYTKHKEYLIASNAKRVLELY